MREILFRGFHKDESGKEKVYVKGEWIKGYWVEGYLSKSRDMQEKPSLLKYCIDYEDNGVMMSALVIPETVGQYTGLKDNNGKKIFEGDIVKVNRHIAHCATKETIETEIGVVEFDNNRLEYSLHNVNGSIKDYGKNYSLNLWRFSTDTNEIIDNIHSNPELLEV